jgi:hypothetical protein
VQLVGFGTDKAKLVEVQRKKKAKASNDFLLKQFGLFHCPQQLESLLGRGRFYQACASKDMRYRQQSW